MGWAVIVGLAGACAWSMPPVHHKHLHQVLSSSDPRTPPQSDGGVLLVRSDKACRIARSGGYPAQSCGPKQAAAPCCRFCGPLEEDSPAAEVLALFSYGGHVSQSCARVKMRLAACVYMEVAIVVGGGEGRGRRMVVSAGVVCVSPDWRLGERFCRVCRSEAAGSDDRVGEANSLLTTGSYCGCDL